jgi:hypothetical protein
MCPWNLKGPPSSFVIVANQFASTVLQETNFKAACCALLPPIMGALECDATNPSLPKTQCVASSVSAPVSLTNLSVFRPRRGGLPLHVVLQNASSGHSRRSIPSYRLDSA